MKTKQVEDMTDEDFDYCLNGIVARMSSVELMAIPGVYEILSEELNNETIESWSTQKETD